MTDTKKRPPTPVRQGGWRQRVIFDDAEHAGARLSWGAIFAGIFTLLAVLLTSSLIAVAIGFGVPDLTSNQPFEGLGTGMAIWAIATLIIALLAAGYVTGLFAGRVGFLHGVVVWAAGLIVMAFIATSAISSALGAAGTMLGAIGNAAGQGVQSVTSVTVDAVDGLTDQVGDELSDIDVNEEIETILVGTDVAELQPEYLQQQVDDARDEIADAGRRLLVSPQDYETILGDLSEDLEARLTTITEAIDRDAIANSVEANTDLTGPEAEEATDNVIVFIEDVEVRLSNADQTLEDLTLQVEALIEDAREVAEDVTDAIARMALWAVLGLLLGLAVASLGGYLGAKTMPLKRETPLDN